MLFIFTPFLVRLDLVFLLVKINFAVQTLYLSLCRNLSSSYSKLLQIFFFNQEELNSSKILLKI